MSCASCSQFLSQCFSVSIPITTCLQRGNHVPRTVATGSVHEEIDSGDRAEHCESEIRLAWSTGEATSSGVASFTSAAAHGAHARSKAPSTVRYHGAGLSERKAVKSHEFSASYVRLLKMCVLTPASWISTASIILAPQVVLRVETQSQTTGAQILTVNPLARMKAG